MIWATVSSWSCFCWLYRASPFLAAKNIINLISVLTIWWCSCVESSLVLLEEGCLLWPVCSLGRMVLAFALLHSVLQTPNLPVIPGVSLEKAMAPHSSTLAWKIPWMEEPGRLQSMGSLESDTTERLHFHFSLSCIGEGNGNPLQCSCLDNPRGRRAWWADIYGVTQSRTRLKWLSSSSSSPLKYPLIFPRSHIKN